MKQYLKRMVHKSPTSAVVTGSTQVVKDLSIPFPLIRKGDGECHAGFPPLRATRHGLSRFEYQSALP